uniref:V-SNARE coiled-coil homology domain-containing protein n=1 Tax=Timema douglasi TaxID=61478 RepID=A0A7R8VCT2_TIMDO|nr:unnamed protein product [Timema douglasi]
MSVSFPSGNEDGLGGPQTSQQQQSQKRLQQTQAKVDEVVGIMRVNVEKVLERDTKLSELDNRADALHQGASRFEQQAGKLKKKERGKPFRKKPPSPWCTRPGSNPGLPVFGNLNMREVRAATRAAHQCTVRPELRCHASLFNKNTIEVGSSSGHASSTFIS